MNKKDLVDETITLYSGLGWKSLFTRIRFWDAPFIEVEKITPKSGKIIDLGCGEGVFTNFMALSSRDREILGIEIDQRRFSEANRGLSNTIFKLGDATKISMPRADCIVLFHLLHHLSSFTDQEVVLKKCAQVLSKGDSLLIVEVKPKLSIKYLLAWFTDHFLVPWLFEKKMYSPIFFRKEESWAALLNNLGFSCKIINAEKGHPFTHVILVCRKN